MHIRDYVKQRKAELDALERSWYVGMRDEPTVYPFDQATFGHWAEQEEAFVETLNEEL